MKTATTTNYLLGTEYQHYLSYLAEKARRSMHWLNQKGVAAGG